MLRWWKYPSLKRLVGGLDCSQEHAPGTYNAPLESSSHLTPFFFSIRVNTVLTSCTLDQMHMREFVLPKTKLTGNLDLVSKQIQSEGPGRQRHALKIVNTNRLFKSQCQNQCHCQCLSLSHCFKSLRLVCSSSHELLILGISVRIF
jgi:hypothetical protein